VGLTASHPARGSQFLIRVPESGLAQNSKVTRTSPEPRAPTTRARSRMIAQT